MIKITSLSEVQALNNATMSVYGLNFCNEKKHCVKDEYMIPLIRIDILINPIIKQLCTFLTAEWFVDNVYDELPSDWDWLFENKPFRITIPDYLALGDLSDMVQDVKTNVNNKHFYDKNYHKGYIYAQQIKQSDADRIQPYRDSGEIIVELRQEDGTIIQI